jgi:hypothetical protein
MWDKEILEQCGCWFTDTGECVKDDLDLNKFARVIIEKEREACAKVCEDSVEYAGDELARQIRARSKKDQRTWVGLTDEELLFLHGHDSELYDLIKVVEAKLKNKNT